jgi:sulfotransferase
MNSKHYYFISGLPRSGSTLLSTILRQNPDIYTDISSPVHGIFESSIHHLSRWEGSRTVTYNQRENVLHSTIDGFYKHVERKIIFDTSRAWTANTTLLKSLFPYTKIICCVRDIAWILDSFERLVKNNPYYLASYNDEETNHCVDTRSDAFMDVKKGGQVIKPWFWLKEGLSANPEMIHLVEYNSLCKHPEVVLRGIYEFIKQPYYHHNFDNVEYSNDLFDLEINVPSLHKINGKVEVRERNFILPQNVIEKYKDMEFWRINKIQMNYR